MATIQWRPEVNALTTPQSYRARVLPRNVVGYDELAAEIAAELDIISPDVARLVLVTRNKLIARHLSNGHQVTEEDAITYSTSLTAKLDSPDDLLPDDADILKVRIYASKPFINEVRQPAKLEKRPLAEKVPVIASAEDNRLKLSDVLFAKGILKLTGSNLFFDETDESGECVIEGTQSGRAVQNQYAMISNTSIRLVPDIPAQAHPWNNEYTVSVSTHYTEHGTPRTGTYRRHLRTPLTLTGFGHPAPPPVGILTGNADTAYVTVIGGGASADEMIRIQAVVQLPEEHLLFSLIDMTENGKAGQVVSITANGTYALSSFDGSKVINLEIKVDNYAGLVQLVRNAYTGRLVDILDVRVD
ncbi:hypothetical protein [Candidatus Electronema sp. PJ]|uniref:hypothetical protein n=1 Tax=Candidatus Electronema sp. PJ TaxID=3401572 RepID=UPI003AA8FED6